MGQTNVPTDHIDLIPGPNVVSNPNEIRLSKSSSGLQVSVNGGAPGPVGGGATVAGFAGRMATLMASIPVTFAQQQAYPMGFYQSGVDITSGLVRNQTSVSGAGILVNGSPVTVALSNNFIQTPKTLPWFLAFRAAQLGAFAGANFAFMAAHDGTNDFVRFGYAGGYSNSFFSMDVGHGGSSTSAVTTVALDNNLHDHAVYYDGSTAIKYYIDSVLAATISVLTNFPTTPQKIATLETTATAVITDVLAAFN